MANSEELLKTSQPNLADLDNLLTELEEKGYTHVIGLFLSSGISGFWANSQILIEDHAAAAGLPLRFAAPSWWREIP